jgi:hypothetical protein
VACIATMTKISDSKVERADRKRAPYGRLIERKDRRARGCIQQYLGKCRVLSPRVGQVPVPCQKVEDENLKNLVLQLREHQSN